MIARSSTAGQACGNAGESWQAALQSVITETDQLLAELGLGTRAIEVDHGSPFPLRVPRAWVARMQRQHAADPLLRQVLPLPSERAEVSGYAADPLHELAANTLPGLIHKYHGRVLVLAASHCAIHCRYCFRRHFPYAQNRPARAQWARAFAYIAADPSIHEVILSGGDPLSLPDRHLQWMLDQIAAIAHVARLRIHSRMPVVIPQRVTPQLVALLRSDRLRTSLVIHANHAAEIDDAVAAALAPLRFGGVTLLNQTVLLAGINDRADVLAELCERLFAVGVLPYYVHLLDHVAGAAHFAVSEERAQALHEALLARLPGYLVPRFVRDQPGAASKLPFAVSGRPADRRQDQAQHVE